LIYFDELYASGDPMDMPGYVYHLRCTGSISNSPSRIHFLAIIKQMVGYLRLHPDLPLVFEGHHFIDNVGAFDLLKINFPGPDSYHVASVQLLHAGHTTHSCSVVASMQTCQHVHDMVQQVPPHMTAKIQDALNMAILLKPPTPVDPDTFIPSTPQVSPLL
jgi:hypothetical protein